MSHDPRSAKAGLRQADSPPSDQSGEARTRRSIWWMVACCAPMVLLAIAILLGVFGPR